MVGIFVVVHIVVSVFLILVVLVQGSKSEGLPGIFGGGGSSTLFGTGAPTFLSRLTTALGVVFMVTSISLSVMLSRRSTSVMEKSVMEESEKPVQGTESGAQAEKSAPENVEPAQKDAEGGSQK